jgi:hypothetical protein
MTARIRKLLYTAHTTFSISWFGAVAAFLVLNIFALKSNDIQIIRSSYIAMDLLGWYVILPSGIASLLTGLIQALFTQWGLFRHYWVAIKFFVTIGCTALLLLHMQPISLGAELASAASFYEAELRESGEHLISKVVLAFIVLLGIIVISVYKPWGKIKISRQKGRE